MKLIIGLGNPGEKHRNNRHNVGHMVIDDIVTRYKAQVTGSLDKKFVTCYMLPITRDILAKPQTFMNSSGSAVKKLVDWFKVSPDDLYVIHDDLDIPLGEYKIQKGKGPKFHYGVRSVEEALGTPDFWRIRVGVDNRNPGNRISGEQYVLQDFTPEEKLIITDVIQRIITDLNGKL